MVPFGAGGATDVVARVLAPGLSKQLGQSVIVENKPGASDQLGTAAVIPVKPALKKLASRRLGRSADEQRQVHTISSFWITPLWG